MQKFVFNLNTTSRWGGQSPFTNLSFDLVAPKHIASEPIIVGGKYDDELTYGDFAEEMAMINKAYIEVMLEGDFHDRIFSFPIPTYNVTEDFPWESEIGELLMKLTAKYGVPYFQNFISSDLNPEDVRSMCCRLQMDLRELRNKTGGLFGAGDLTGSIGVVTLNLPKLAYLAQSEDDFLELIEEYAELAKDSLEYKRKVINNNLEAGMFPWSKRYLKNGYKGHFSTIGLLGGHEACLNLIGKGIETEGGVRLMRRVLNHLRRVTSRFQEETGNLYNLEATPAEGTSYRLAKIDKALYADIKAQGNGTPLLHQLHAAARGHLRGRALRPGTPEPVAAPLHRRHRVPHLPGRGRGRSQVPQELHRQGVRQDQDSLHLGHADLLHLQGARLHPGRTLRVPHLRAGGRGLHPHRGLLPARVPLEQGQAGGIHRPRGLQRLPVQLS